MNDEPVQACPPSAGYRFRKFARRNKATIATVAAIGLSLIIGAGVASWQAIRATQQRQLAVLAQQKAVAAEGRARTEATRANQEASRAETEADKARTEAAIAEAVREFLEKDLLGLVGASAQVEAEVAPDPDIKLRTVVDRAAASIDHRFVDQPEVKAAIFDVLATIYSSLGDYRKADEFRAHSMELGESIWESNDERLLAKKVSVAFARFHRGFFVEAESMYRGLLPVVKRELGDDHATTCSCKDGLAWTLYEAGSA